MKKVIFGFLFLILFSSLVKAEYGMTGSLDSEKMWRSSEVTVGMNHQVFSTGCIAVGYVILIPTSTTSSTQFSIVDSSVNLKTSGDYINIATFSYLNQNSQAIKINRKMKRGLMFNTINFGGASGTAVLLYDFLDGRCYSMP